MCKQSLARLPLMGVSFFIQPRDYKTFSMLIWAEHEIYPAHKYKTIVGILTFISLINTTPEILKARNFSFVGRYFCFLWAAVEISCQLSWVQYEKKFFNLGAWLFFNTFPAHGYNLKGGAQINVRMQLCISANYGEEWSSQD